MLQATVMPGLASTDSFAELHDALDDLTEDGDELFVDACETPGLFPF